MPREVPFPRAQSCCSPGTLAVTWENVCPLKCGLTFYLLKVKVALTLNSSEFFFQILFLTRVFFSLKLHLNGDHAFHCESIVLSVTPVGPSWLHWPSTPVLCGLWFHQIFYVGVSCIGEIKDTWQKIALEWAFSGHHSFMYRGMLKSSHGCGIDG